MIGVSAWLIPLVIYFFLLLNVNYFSLRLALPIFVLIRNPYYFFDGNIPHDNRVNRWALILWSCWHNFFRVIVSTKNNNIVWFSLSIFLSHWNQFWLDNNSTFCNSTLSYMETIVYGFPCEFISRICPVILSERNFSKWDVETLIYPLEHEYAVEHLIKQANTSETTELRKRVE